MATLPVQDQADFAYRAWLREVLAQAATRFDLRVTDKPVFGWRDRSIGARANGPTGERWLRVVTEEAQWVEGLFWTGNVESRIITALANHRS